MKSYLLALVMLCSLSLAAPAMAADLNVIQVSYTDMWVNGTGFTPDAAVTLSTSMTIPAKLSGDKYSYEITAMHLPVGSVLTLDASPVNDDLKLYVQKNWIIKKTFENGSFGISYNYNDATDTARVMCSIPTEIAGTFQNIKVYGSIKKEDPLVNLRVTVDQYVTADGSGSFSEKVGIGAIPAGKYGLSATDGTNTATKNIALYGPLYRIAITEPDTREMALDTTEDYLFEATGYASEGTIVGSTTFIWTSVNTHVGTIDSTGYFKADNAGNTEVYASSGTKKSNSVIVYVNAPIAEKTIVGSGNDTASNSTGAVTLNELSVNATTNMTGMGDPSNGTNNANIIPGSDNQPGKGTFANADMLIREALSKVWGMLRW